ncbi:MAG: RluA family pseudouridine synthase [Ruminococcaceae bacterium]|jgi:23S rRNA pseudouridine1911/1915/1917 synthase|nr:RluA family pseudouridine synthase [Oscillospiraceae bacterium]
MNEREIIEVAALDAGKRLDAFVAEAFPELSRSRAQSLCESGDVTVNGKTVKKNHKLLEGDSVAVLLPEPESVEIVPQDIPLNIVYEDDSVLVIDKPKGMVVHPAPGHPDGTIVNAVLFHCGERLSGIGGEIRPGIVHRIDKDTSGLLIIAKNDHAHRCLTEQLKDRSLSRVYDAIVRGSLKDDEGRIDAPIGRSLRDRKKMAVNGAAPREAATRYEVVSRYPGYTRVRCHLETGRTHQIRVHMASIGHPVAGDEVYGGGREKELEGQCLHAGSIRFIHPDTGEPMSFSCPLPAYFTAFEERLKGTL